MTAGPVQNVFVLGLDVSTRLAPTRPIRSLMRALIAHRHITGGDAPCIPSTPSTTGAPATATTWTTTCRLRPSVPHPLRRSARLAPARRALLRRLVRAAPPAAGCRGSAQPERGVARAPPPEPAR